MAKIIVFEGAGRALFRHFNSLDGCEARAVFDPRTDALNRARRFLSSILITEDLCKFLESDIDRVAVCSPDSPHAGHIAKSLEAGKHTVCEKPLTDVLEGCRKILQVEQDSNCRSGKQILGSGV